LVCGDAGHGGDVADDSERYWRGYGRSGTASLKLALEKIGFGPCHHMSEVLPNAEPVALWTLIGQGEADVDQSLWNRAYEGYDAAVILTRRKAGSGLPL
jgi:Sulfotransferase domain